MRNQKLKMSHFFNCLKGVVVVLCVLSAILHIVLKHTGMELIQVPNMFAKTRHGNDDNINRNTTYVLPPSPLGQTDDIPARRVMAAFPANHRESDPGWQEIFGPNRAEACEITSKMVITRHDLDVAGSSSDLDVIKWRLSTFDRNGTRKTVGGDDLYVTYTAHGQTEPTAVAQITDLGNGDYTLSFVNSPTVSTTDNNGTKVTETHGTLSVVLEQSCRMGRLYPPLKEQWQTSGGINQFYWVDHIPAPQTIAEFVPPNRDGAIDLGQYHAVAVVGDSLLGQFVCREHFDGCTAIRPRLLYSMVQSPLNTLTVASHFSSLIRQVLTRLQQHHRPGPGDGPVVALMLGSGVWDVLADRQSSADFEDHLEACRILITSTQAAFPDVKIFWKSMTAMHIHKVVEGNQDWTHIQRIYYMSNSRAHRLYELQRIVMKELNTTVLDVFPTTYLSAHWTRRGDGRHYQPNLNQMALSYFYPS